MSATNTTNKILEKQKVNTKLYGDRYRVVGYLPPKFSNLMQGYVAYTGESESSCISQMVRKFFEAMPEPERQRIMNFSKNSY